MCSRATPAASLAVTVHVREHVPVLADSPALDELRIEASAESRAVALELIVSGHLDNGTAGSERFAGGANRMLCPHGKPAVSSERCRLRPARMKGNVRG